MRIWNNKSKSISTFRVSSLSELDSFLNLNRLEDINKQKLVKNNKNEDVNETIQIKGLTQHHQASFNLTWKCL